MIILGHTQSLSPWLRCLCRKFWGSRWNPPSLLANGLWPHYGSRWALWNSSCILYNSILIFVHLDSFHCGIHFVSRFEGIAMGLPGLAALASLVFFLRAEI